MDTKLSRRNKGKISRQALVLLLCLSVLSMGFGSLPQTNALTGTTIKVTITTDILANDGKCSLREAVIAANTNKPSGTKFGECPAGKGDVMDTILLTPRAVYTLTRNSTFENNSLNGDLDIKNNKAKIDLTIQVNNNGKATIKQNAKVDDRVFEILSGKVIIKGLTISAGGNVGSGGGIFNAGKLTLIACKIKGNKVGWEGAGILNTGSGNLIIKDSTIISDNVAAAFAGGIKNYGTLTITNSKVLKNVDTYGGGGINNEGKLTFDHSTLSANTSSQGGALYNSGTATIKRNSMVGGLSTAAGNIASDSGGGLFNTGTLVVANSKVSYNYAPYGGGLFNWIGGTMTISNSTVSYNSANQGGGITTHENSTTVINNGSMISNNSALWAGAGVNNWGTLTITGSVLNGNTSPGVGDAVNSDVNINNALSITDSCIVSNGDTAIFNSQPASQIATGNWWGDASGPTHASNPTGTGDSVGDNIDFSSWLTAPPAICTP